jgi:hypothetical protein
VGAWHETDGATAAAAVHLLEQQWVGLAATNLSGLRQAFLSALAQVRPRSDRS